MATLLLVVSHSGPSATASPISTDAVPAHTYDNDAAPVRLSTSVSERGPPTFAYDYSGRTLAVDTTSHGTSTRPQSVMAGAHTIYDHGARSAQLDNVTATTGTAAGAREADLRAPSDTMVAANAVPRAPHVLRVGELKLPAVPKGATGTPSKYGDGLQYAIPRGTPELDPRVASIRIMGPRTTGKHQYPNGLAVYQNAQGQRVNPLTGQMIHDLSDPFAHIPLP
jgi:hypothetical protein